MNHLSQLVPFRSFKLASALWLAGGGLWADPTARADVFAEAWFQNSFANITSPTAVSTNTPTSIAVWSAGNAGPYPAPGGAVPAATFTAAGGSITVRLVESATGQAVAGPLGFPNAPGALRAEGFRYLTNSATYGTMTTLTGTLQRPATGWQIRFPGVIDPVTGNVMGATDQNYDEALNREAQRWFEAALRADPFDQEAAQGILIAIHQRVMPYTFAGNNALLRADQVRLSFGDVAQEIAVLETNALAFYDLAARQVVEAFGIQPAAGLLDGSYPYAGQLNASSLAQLRRDLLASYARTLAAQAETTYRLVRLKYLATYQNPLAPGFNPGPLLDMLDKRRRSLQGQLLFSGLFDGVSADEVMELLPVRQQLGILEHLRDSIANGRLSFVALGSTNNAQSFTSREYPPEYVPFFRDTATQSLQQDNSFDNLKNRAKELTGWSVARDESAKAAKRDFDQDAFKLDEALQQVQTRYSEELGNLCGLVRDEQNNLVPDVALALLPPEQRDSLYAYSKAGETKGAIYAQYRRIDLAQDEVSGASLDLSNLISNIAEKQKIGQKIANGQENIAYLILENGERLKALDFQQGEAEADAAEKLGRNNTSTEMGVISGAMTGAASGGWWGAAAGAVSAWIGHSEAANAGKNAGEIQAELARRRAEIQAQRTQIMTTQSAKVEFQMRDETLLRTEEAIHAMVLDAQRLKLNILLAEERRDMEDLELQNMLGRAQFLVQEYVAAVHLQLANPLNSPDFRLIRDLTLRDAEETFVHAQEWAFLAAKAAQYRENRQTEATQINQLLRQVLAARNGQQLTVALQGLESAMTLLIAGLGGTQLDPAIISLRNDIFQKNIARYDANGDLDLTNSSLELTPPGTTSDEQWHGWLQNSIEALPGHNRLVLRFATSLLRQGGADQRNVNPLYKPTQYNGLIFYRPTQGDLGVEVNIRGRQLSNLPDANPPRIYLRQEGASYIRNTPATSDPTGAGLMVWNLSRARLWQAAYLTAGNLDPAELTRAAETSTIQASVNGFKNRAGGERLHELSAANDKWVLIIDEDETANQPLMDQLDKITDIEIRFSIRGF
ncbi:MAG TPA: hypothetical protein VL361_15835 [Candidatus Limnocylindrales bacterium]|jgi:hypothetical protein|nr:hypothetical protein [Candidatus Limnocylindrales bacterium]